MGWTLKQSTPEIENRILRALSKNVMRCIGKKVGCLFSRFTCEDKNHRKVETFIIHVHRPLMYEILFRY